MKPSPTNPDGTPKAGVALGPYPPCQFCGSGGFPADIEINSKGSRGFVCIECFDTQAPKPLRDAATIDRTRLMALRQEPYSRSWRGWKRRDAADATEQPTWRAT